MGFVEIWKYKKYHNDRFNFKSKNIKDVIGKRMK